jgi:hypothetical protein
MTHGLVDWLQLLVSIVLAGITFFYVKFTRSIMEAAVAQAKDANVTASVAMRQCQLPQQLLPIRMAIDGTRQRIRAHHARTARRDGPRPTDPIYRPELGNALVLARTISPAVAINLEVTIQNADMFLARAELARDMEGIDRDNIGEANTAIFHAEKKLIIAESWLLPLLKALEGLAYPTDKRVHELNLEAFK